LDPAEYDYMFRLEDRLWWYVGMRRIVEKVFRAEFGDEARMAILDAGAGTGGSVQLLRKFGEVWAFDFAPLAVRLCRSRESGRLAVASTDAIPFRDRTFDLVTSFDVICQLEEGPTRRAVEEFHRVLRPGGWVFVRVPAFQFLHGPHDRTLHTRHRYTLSELSRLLGEAGFRMRHGSYVNTLLFPVAAGRRLLARVLPGAKTGESDVRPVPGPLNAIFLGMLSLEAELAPRLRLPFGLSVIALARKP
jgi:SAM-dependent methyltransferase